MSNRQLIKNANLVNEGQILQADVLIKNNRIEQIASSITAQDSDIVIEANGNYLLPGMIDDQVHFREPGLTHKGNIYTESRAAVAGGITSYMEMPNVDPATTNIAALEDKFAIAKINSAANYSFYLGATEDNLEQIKQLDPKKYCGVKVFMGASTGNLLVENPTALENIFKECPSLIVTHCESGPIIAKNHSKFLNENKAITIHDHPLIRDVEACYASSSYAVSLAKKYNSQLHVLHITTEKELSLFQSGDIKNKQITAEACVHHLWFNNQDYYQLGNQIKCNPAIKFESDRLALLKGVREGVIDIIATDHAPHTWHEKQQEYNKAPAGLPLVQHALLSLIDQVANKQLTLTQVVEKTAHNPAIRYGIAERGFIREGYFADLVLVDPNSPYLVEPENILYQCQWSPFLNHQFKASIKSTWVNGNLVFDGQQVIPQPSSAMRLNFEK